MDDLEGKIERFADLIIQSKNIVVLSGAGMSTESGIPDFRSPGTGLWTKVNPSEFASIHSYVSDTGKNIKFMLELGMSIFKAKPHAGHKALTKLQKMGKLNGVLTQNIDGLHQKAHTKNVEELHGTANEAVCMRCNEIFPITVLVNQVVKGDSQPSCPKCSGLLKPNAVFFGEPLDSDTLERADDMIKDCDLLIVLGSSLLVYPVAFYPRKLITNGAKIAIINIQETEIDGSAEVIIHKKIGEVFPRILERVVEKMDA
ncbi:MAG: NAD-dependent protein deacylase [Candidatus Lokiarchaeota archaeon]|nr:NAD-dependent protein deacylase [Candidatus Lokiarchaeota archaeon]MBD3201574.1 NAD-dependent protein deacylase [Candidatus Lokiarchaeota archaeon]